jgi:type I restriction enzyme, S subunit
LALPSAGYDRHFKYLKRTEVVLPPLSEQRRIAAILDQADALRAKRREALALLDGLAQAVFVEMFGEATDGYFSWPLLELSSVASVLTGYAFRSNEYVEPSSATLRLCRGANVMPGRIDWQDLACWPIPQLNDLSEFALDAGDIVMAMDRPWISDGFKLARVRSPDLPALLVQRVARIRTNDKALIDFVYVLLQQQVFAAHCHPTETTIPHISPKEIRCFSFRLPPKQLVELFALRLQGIESLKAAQTAALAESNALFTSLQHRAFTGQLA